MRLFAPLAIPFVLALPAFGAGLAIDHEELAILGWNQEQCSVALAHHAYPKIGVAIADEPVMTRIGTLTIPAKETEFKVDWFMDRDGARSWDPAVGAAARRRALKEGYTEKGFIEILRDAPVAERRDIPRLLMSKDLYRVQGEPQWLEPPWRLAKIHYSPLASACALFVYEDKSRGSRFYRMLLVRLGNPAIRYDRAVAHAVNGLLLLEQGDRPGALAETGIAAAMAPEHAESRYNHASMLALNGRTDASLNELEVAIGFDKKYRKRASDDRDWDDLRWHPRFQELVLGKAQTP